MSRLACCSRIQQREPLGTDKAKGKKAPAWGRPCGMGRRLNHRFTRESGPTARKDTAREKRWEDGKTGMPYMVNQISRAAQHPARQGSSVYTSTPVAPECPWIQVPAMVPEKGGISEEMGKENKLRKKREKRVTETRQQRGKKERRPRGTTAFRIHAQCAEFRRPRRGPQSSMGNADRRFPDPYPTLFSAPHSTPGPRSWLPQQNKRIDDQHYTTCS
jgi:hypothetical protein